MGVNNWIKREGEQTIMFSVSPSVLEKDKFFLFADYNSYKFFISQSKEYENLMLNFKLLISLGA